MISDVEPITGASAHTNCLTDLLKSEPEPPTTRGKSENYTPKAPAIKTIQAISARRKSGTRGLSRPIDLDRGTGRRVQTSRTRAKRRLPTW